MTVKYSVGVAYPTAAQLEAWAQTLTHTNWAVLAGRLTTAIERDRRGGSAQADGYPAATMGGSGGTSELTSTEAAARARIEGTRRDEHHERTRQAVAYLADVMMALGACVTQLDKIEARVVHVDGREPGCSNHASHGLQAVRHRGDLCRDCYEFKGKFGVVPPFKLLDDHERGIRWTTASVARALADDRVAHR